MPHAYSFVGWVGCEVGWCLLVFYRVFGVYMAKNTIKAAAKRKAVQWADDDDGSEGGDDDMPGLDDMDLLVGPAKDDEVTLDDMFDVIDQEEVEAARRSTHNVYAKPIGERNIVEHDYRFSDPYSQMLRDHRDELADFRMDERTRQLDTYLSSEHCSEHASRPAFLIQSLHSLGLVAGHLQHQRLSDSCIVVDVLIRNLGLLHDVNLSTTVYLVFEPVASVEGDMDITCTLINHIFDMRRVSIEEQTLGKLGDLVNK